jgi:acyl dehydratase
VVDHVVSFHSQKIFPAEADREDKRARSRKQAAMLDCREEASVFNSRAIGGAMQSELKVGTTLPVWRVIAANDAVDSGNPIHDDTVAKQLGFGGGLVPGVTVYGYLTHPLVAQFGIEFLTRGYMEVRFRRPVYEGEALQVNAQITGQHDGRWQLDLNVSNPAGELCAIGTAQFPAPPVTETELPPRAPLPSPRRPATPEALQVTPVLGTLDVRFDAALAPTFLTILGETLPLYHEIAHPAWLLRQANYLVDRNLALGPWIHVASTIQHLGVVRSGEDIAVRGRVVELTTHKGNDYADIDVVLMTDRPIMRVLHRAIYRMGKP